MALMMAFFHMPKLDEPVVTVRSWHPGYSGALPSPPCPLQPSCVVAGSHAWHDRCCCAGAQAWIQDFAWSEDQLPRRCAERAEHANLPAREPMFCMETALKLLYWSFLARVLAECRTCSTQTCV